MSSSILSRLALLGLASTTSMAFAVTTHGQIHFDGRFTLHQEKENGSSVADQYEKAHNLQVSRARLDFSGDVAQDWTYHLRAQYHENENDQIGVDPNQIISLDNNIKFTVNSDLLRSTGVSIARAYLSWSGIEGLSVKIGRIGTPEVTSDRLYYRPYIGQNPNDRAVGSVTNYSGNHPGFSVQGAAGSVGYTFGLWKQTDLRKLLLDNTKVDVALTTPDSWIDIFEDLQDENNSDPVTVTTAEFFENVAVELLEKLTSFDTKNLRVGFGGRLNFAQELQNGAAVGVGLGYNQAPLNMSIYGIAVAQLPTEFVHGEESPEEAAARILRSYAYGSATYKELSNLGIDISATYKSFQFNAGYQYQQMKNDSAMEHSADRMASGAQPGEGATVPSALTYNFLEKSASAQAFWVELGYIVVGDSYKFCKKNAVISGVKLREKQAGFEIAARYGVENRKNMLALLTPTGWSDFNTYADGKTDSDNARANADIVSISGHPTDTALAIQINNSQMLTNTNYVNTELGMISREENGNFFETKMTGFAIVLNYYITENAILKIEYENRHNEFKRPNPVAVPGEVVTSWRDSAFNKNLSTLRLRADYTF